MLKKLSLKQLRRISIVSKSHDIVGQSSYTGMNVKVNLGGDNWFGMPDLSGGEKSIVALSLLFALNSLTSSMVFLLDEVDCALDKVYREGLSKLLEHLTREAKI